MKKSISRRWIWILLLSVLTGTKAHSSFELSFLPQLVWTSFRDLNYRYQANFPGTANYDPLIQDGLITSQAIEILENRLFENSSELSFVLQFIWKGEDDPRDLALFNLQIYGKPGMGDDSSFSSAGAFKAQVKEDSFVRIYIPHTPFYRQFGKYTTDLPYNFGAQLVNAQLELGYKLEEMPNEEERHNFHLWYSAIFHRFGERVTQWQDIHGGAYDPLDPTDTLWEDPYGQTFFFSRLWDPRYHQNDQVVHLFALNWGEKEDTGRLVIRYPFVLEGFNWGRFFQFPSLMYSREKGRYGFDLMGGLSHRFISNNGSSQQGLTLATRGDFYIKHLSWYSSFFWAALLTAGDQRNTYAFTALSYEGFQVEPSNSFRKLYSDILNHTGHYTLGIGQEFYQDQMWNLRASIASHWAFRPEALPYQEIYTSAGSHVGLSYFLNLKHYSPLGKHSSFELLFSLFQPTQLSLYLQKENASLNENLETRHFGLQFTIKYEHLFVFHQ